MRFVAGDFELSGALLAGPALSWATAVAEPPLAGAADMTAGAVLSFKALVEYPRRGSIFAQASASGSALLPGVQVKLGTDAAEPLGAWPLEASRRSRRALGRRLVERLTTKRGPAVGPLVSLRSCDGSPRERPSGP